MVTFSVLVHFSYMKAYRVWVCTTAYIHSLSFVYKCIPHSISIFLSTLSSTLLSLFPSRCSSFSWLNSTIQCLLPASVLCSLTSTFPAEQPERTDQYWTTFKGWHSRRESYKDSPWEADQISQHATAEIAAAQPLWLLQAALVELLSGCTLALRNAIAPFNVWLSPLQFLLVVQLLVFHLHRDGLYPDADHCTCWPHSMDGCYLSTIYSKWESLQSMYLVMGLWLVASGSHCCIRRWQVHWCVQRGVVSLDDIPAGSMITSVSGLIHLAHQEVWSLNSFYCIVHYCIECIFSICHRNCHVGL